MTKFEKLYIVESESSNSPFSNSTSTKTGVVLKIENENFHFQHKFGRCITTDEFNQLFLLFMQDFTKDMPLSVYKRTDSFRFVWRQGQSGCQDTFIETCQDGSGFPRRRKLLHESMCGKVNEHINCFLHDILDLFVACGKFGIQEGHYVFPNVDTEINIIKVVEPRDITAEPGWTKPGEIAAGVTQI